MVLLAFLIDTSASMNQRTCLGTSYLDLAKGAVESFIKIRTRDPSAKGDRYMLITYDENTKSIKAGWKGVNLQMFMSELKNLDGLNLSDVGRGLKETFDLLNVNRLHTGVDNYGLGRNPFYLEPAIILLLTDGCLAMDPNGIINEITIPRHDLLPGAELTKELYRWDQRLFTLQLKIPGFAQPVPEKHLAITPDDVQLSTICDLTGGKLYNIGGFKQLIQSLESIAQKMTIPGVVVNFMKHGPDSFYSDGQIEDTKADENTFLDISEIKDIHHINGKMDKQFSSIFSDQSNFFGNQPHGGINGFVNGQGILPSPLNKNFNKTRLFNGDIGDINQPLKTEGLSTSENIIPETPIRGAEEPEGVFSPATFTLSTSWHNQHKMIYVRNNPKAGKGNVCHWPIPESFWPDPAATKIPPRDSHPIIRFTCKPVDAVVGNLNYNIPFDKYELEPSPLTQNILGKRQCNTAWQAFVKGSSPNSEIGYPFGYLKASTNFQTVNLFVLPYNYPVLLPLLDELFQIHKCKPTIGWKQSFQEYLQTVPSYYYDPLRNALNSMKVSTNLIPDHMTGTLSYSVSTYLKKLKHEAKNRADRFMQQKKEPENFMPADIPRVPQLIDGKLRDFKELLIHNSSSQKKRDKASKISFEDIKPFERRKIPITASKKHSWETYRNPFDIRHGDIIDHVHRMRTQFFHMAASSSANSDKTLAEEEKRHDVAITVMGNFLEHLQQNKSLREVDPSQVRIHTFGNPFKLKQQDQQDQFIAVDEADVNENLPISAVNQRKRPTGDMMFPLQKGKRKRSETPPPSRKPVGRPNVPPAKPMTIRYTPDSKGVLKDLTDALDKNHVETEGKDSGGTTKKSNNVVSNQLRKLQEKHRSKKETIDIHNEGGSSYSDEVEQIDSQSPILSILRTSLEESDDRDNDEVSQINERQHRRTGDLYDDDENSNDSTSTTRSTPSNVVTPVPSAILSPLLMEDMFRNMPSGQLKGVYKELHTRKVIKVRQAVWHALRERKKFSVIKDMVKSLSVNTETKYMFVMNLIYETKRFQAAQVEDDLKNLLREIQAIKNS